MYTDSAAYHLLLPLHSWLRWAVLLTGLPLVAIAAARWRSGRPWDATADRLALAFLIASGLEFANGFILYFFVTPWVSAFVAFPEQVLAARGMRFWAVEHTAATIAALLAVYWGRIQIFAAAEERKAKTALLWFGGAMLLILVSMPWPFLRIGRPWFRGW